MVIATVVPTCQLLVGMNPATTNPCFQIIQSNLVAMGPIRRLVANPDAQEKRWQLLEAEGGGGRGRRRGERGRKRRRGCFFLAMRRGSDARPPKVGSAGPVENSWIGSDILFLWASKWRGDLARGRFPRGFWALGNGRVPGGIPGFQTSPQCVFFLSFSFLYDSERNNDKGAISSLHGWSVRDIY